MIQSSGYFVHTNPLPDPGDTALELLHESEEGHCLLLKGHRNDRIVVYKALKEAFREDPVYQRMLRREYEIGISLKHPGICEVLAWTTLPRYGDCIEMEWIDGERMDRWLATHPDKEERRQILLDLCDALAYLHRKQVIHKDLKPENIMITASGSYPKILDFGLSDTDSILTGKDPGGTRLYAAPEVLAGEAAQARSDIFSLGRMLQQMGPEFSRIARKCTASAPSARYSSAEEVRHALESHRSMPRLLIPALLLAALIGLWAILHRPDPVRTLFLDAVEQVRQTAMPS